MVHYLLWFSEIWTNLIPLGILNFQMWDIKKVVQFRMCFYLYITYFFALIWVNMSRVKCSVATIHKTCYANNSSARSINAVQSNVCK